MINTKSSPVFKSTLPVYFVGILSTLVDAEMNGWFSLNSDLVQDIISYKATLGDAVSSPSISSDKIINSSQYSTPIKQRDNSGGGSSKTSSSLEKRLDYMSTYLKNVFFSLSLNQASLDGLISIYELMKLVVLIFQYFKFIR